MSGEKLDALISFAIGCGILSVGFGLIQLPNNPEFRLGRMSGKPFAVIGGLCMIVSALVRYFGGN